MAALLFAFWYAGYFGAPHIAVRPNLFDPSTALDAALPCVPWLVWVYLLGLILPFAPVLLMPSRLVMRTAGAYALLIACATLVFVVAPADSHALRAQCSGQAYWALARLQAIDPATNLFPSLHVGFAVMASLCAMRAKLRRTFAVLVVAAAIQAVTVCLVKQHYLLDAVAGAVLAAAAYAIAFSPAFMPARPARESSPAPEGRR